MVAAPAATASLPAFPAPERELMVPVPGGRIFVRVNGNATTKAGKLPVIFVHGGPGGTHVALLEALALADDRMVILYDQLDSGRSDQPNDPANWKVARFVAELEAIRAALGIGRWHVVGHSWGGTVALEYAAQRPTALAGLVLSSPLVSTRRWIAACAASARAVRYSMRFSVSRTVQRRLSWLRALRRGPGRAQTSRRENRVGWAPLRSSESIAWITPRSFLWYSTPRRRWRRGPVLEGAFTDDGASVIGGHAGPHVSARSR